MKFRKLHTNSIACFAVSAFLFVAMGAIAGGDKKSEAYVKDLHVLQVPMAELKPSKMESSIANAGEKKRLTVKASVDRQDKTYKHGDKLTLTLETSQDAYVWVFDTGTSGKVHQIFPNKHETENLVRAGKKVMIPKSGVDYDFVVSHPKGAELLTTIASKDKHSLTEDMISESTGTFLALKGNSASVAKDLSISLRKKHREWVTDQQVFYVK